MTNFVTAPESVQFLFTFVTVKVTAWPLSPTGARHSAKLVKVIATVQEISMPGSPTKADKARAKTKAPPKVLTTEAEPSATATVARKSPRDKRIVSITTGDRFADGALPASPLGKRSTLENTALRENDSPSAKKSHSPHPARPPSAGAITPEMIDAVDRILTRAFKAERQFKEFEEDENLPGLLGRCASDGKARAKRRSKMYEDDFGETMGPTLEAVFKKFDTDNSGELDESELKAAFDACGRPSDDDTIKKSIQALDTDNNGLISLEEFKAIAWKVSIGP